MAGPNSSGGGGDNLGELYGDLWVVVRDFDPSDGGGNGEPVLDENGQIVPIGYNPETGETFPIYFVEGIEEDYEVPPDLLPYIQEIELERANIIRAPDNVMENALAEALAKIDAGTEITAEASGRIMVDGVLIDSPRENVALYQLIMTAGGATSWTEVQANAAAELPQPIADLIASGWNPTGLLAGVFSKFNAISLDAVITSHTLMGVNEVTGSGETLNIDHFGFTDGVNETFDYDRVATYGDVWMRWYQDLDGNPANLEAVQRTLLDVIWGEDLNGDGVNDVGSGVGWTDEYLALSDDGQSFVMAEGSAAGINDWAQSVEDARQAIYVLHEYIGAEEVEAPPVLDEILTGTLVADLLAGWGGDDVLYGLAGDDTLEGGDGNDTVYAGDGDDLIDGGAGDDLLRGASGADTLYGDVGNDTIKGNTGADLIFGNEGDDLIGGGMQADTIFGGFGNDTIWGGLGTDLVYMNDGDDVFNDHAQFTAYGDDKVFGGDGNDTFNGVGGNDSYDGGNGNDRLLGAVGDDQLTGGADADVFAFVSGAGHGDDTITDFEDGIDRMEVSGAVFGDLTISDAGGNALVAWADGSVTLLGISDALITSDDFLFV
ncbi:calcium-binding protein [Thetidibacter halocola]|uniref:Calcium-binding protein n=1 Tax=Thetidibacter halocola TaxID=2827239 RepID=A0A8J7W9N9_9RHOB|nr:calcium-binding protein [Thetidibacter halocola]MBS0122519.1 hypothetical protein [Thetidibacter halocola]